jgi:hypothetical protein
VTASKYKRMYGVADYRDPLYYHLLLDTFQQDPWRTRRIIVDEANLGRTASLNACRRGCRSFSGAMPGVPALMASLPAAKKTRTYSSVRVPSAPIAPPIDLDPRFGNRQSESSAAG